MTIAVPGGIIRVVLPVVWNAVEVKSVVGAAHDHSCARWGRMGCLTCGMECSGGKVCGRRSS